VSNNLLAELINAFRCLPGVGPKSAQRMAFHLLERNRSGGAHLAHTLLNAVERIGHCEQCRTLSETNVCSVCSNPRRDKTILCVVENPMDVQAIEQSGTYEGQYFVLMGRLSPLDGIGPSEIGLDNLAERLDSGEVKELILATNSTVEGEATAHYIAEQARHRGVKSSRLAQGVPLGGELEYVDGNTLAHAIMGRREL